MLLVLFPPSCKSHTLAKTKLRYNQGELVYFFHSPSFPSLLAERDDFIFFRS